MMYSVEVYGDFDFLPEEVLIGVLEYERRKGFPSFRFAYDEQFLASFPQFRLSVDLGNFPGNQSAATGIFSCFGDALPDRWGRALIDKRERAAAQKSNKIPRQFDDFGYLVRIDDLTRMGAFRFKYNGEYLGAENIPQKIPPLASLDAFIREAHEIERYDTGVLGDLREDWLDNIWRQGSSLGGARPKANILDAGNLWIAKIPSINDDYDIALWEHFTETLAKKAGIRTAETRIIRVGPTPFHTLLSKRFDRDGDKRIHFASSLTLTGFHDGDNAENNKGYIDIVDAMAGDAGICHLDDNLAELYRRVAFSIMIGNHDDHFRNHGFLLREKGWELSPAFDINPTNMIVQSLMISDRSNRSSLKELLEASDYYLLGRETAEEIVREVLLTVRDWRKTAMAIGIPEKEQERFARRIEYSLEEGRKIAL